MRLLVLTRNEIAYFMKCSTSINSVSKIPHLLKRINDCEHCYQAAECLTYHAAIESGDATSSGVSELFKHIVKGL